ncbi:hypothetical protein, partial [Methylophaga sp. UBA5088]|uniref:hypothetical protein n=1 Tax=Methylophaga sp. UBA5088 TaxID=1946898 RepID=UPI00259C6E0D
MTLVQKQRLIGAALLVLVIGVIAWFLLASVAKKDIEDIVEKPIPFDSVIEPLDDEPERDEPITEVDASLTDEGEKIAEKDTPLPEKQDTAPAPAPAPSAPEKQTTISREAP